MSKDSDNRDRITFLGIEESDLERLSRLRPVLEERAPEFVLEFYHHLQKFPKTREMLEDPETLERLLELQRGYLLSLAGPELDDDYVEDRRSIGRTHERIGLEPRWYMSAYALYLSLLTPQIVEMYADEPEEAAKTLVALQRLLILDAQLAIEAYIDRREEELAGVNQELRRAQRVLERDYDEQGRQLRRTTQRARAAEELASVGTLVAGLAHEIGTPMGVIQGHAKLLEKAVEGERARWRIATIQEQIGRISKIIQSLLNMARPSSGQRMPVDLEDLVEASLSFLSEKFGNRGIQVVREISPVPRVMGDAERLQQLCLNLFLNAADAMPRGGELRVRLDEGRDGSVRIRIADDGIGIPCADIEHIFDPFFTSKPAGRGSGLGLMVASGIVADHGGEIRVASEPGHGTEFEIRLPPAQG